MRPSPTRFARVAMAAALLFITLSAARAHAQAQTPSPKIENVVLITLDGVRTEEIFGGLDAAIYKSTLDEKAKLEEQDAYKRYAAATPQARREKLMPFFWTMLMREHGSIAGNASAGAKGAGITNGVSEVRLSNTKRFSYPGYAELMLGVAYDNEITSNDGRFYPHETIFEFMKRSLSLTDAQVAVFGSWDVFHYIPRQRDGVLTVNAGFEPYDSPTPGMSLVSAMQTNVAPPFGSARYDEFTFQFAMDYLSRQKPRLLYMAFDETDDWAHSRRYDLVLRSLARADGRLKELWTRLEGDPQYRGKTAIIITTDHGRGHTAKDWSTHGEKIEGAQETWMAFIVPGSPLRGEWSTASTTHPSQVAATIARLLGQDFSSASPQAGKPIEQIFAK